MDSDVAELYGVQTKEINQAVRNNPEKFPIGYIWELSNEETRSLRSKFLTLKNLGRGQHSKYPPKAFTEKGLVGHHSEKSAGCGDYYCPCGGVCETEGTVKSYHTNSAARGELRGAENVAAARRPVGGRIVDGCDAGSK